MCYCCDFFLFLRLAGWLVECFIYQNHIDFLPDRTKLWNSCTLWYIGRSIRWRWYVDSVEFAIRFSKVSKLNQMEKHGDNLLCTCSQFLYTSSFLTDWIYKLNPMCAQEVAIEEKKYGSKTIQIENFQIFKIADKQQQVDRSTIFLFIKNLPNFMHHGIHLLFFLSFPSWTFSLLYISFFLPFIFSF